MSDHETPARRPSPHPAGEPSWVHSHAHEPNLQTPAGDGSFVVIMPGGSRRTFSPADLAALPYTAVTDCLIVSTGHGISGPFAFGGARLDDLLDLVLSAHGTQDPAFDETTVADRSDHRSDHRSDQRGGGRNTPPGAPAWRYVDLVSADGFGTRLTPADLAAAGDRPILLAYAVDGTALTRDKGLVRLIVPSETDDALRQVKWLATITIV